MADINDIYTNPMTFNYDFSIAIRKSTEGIKLTREQFNATKHAGVSAVVTDVYGAARANFLGHMIEHGEVVK